MSLIDIDVFQLAPGADEAEFRHADERLQIATMLGAEGLLRRTTARSASGSWLVLSHWASREAYEAAKAALASDPATAEFEHFIDAATRRGQQFEPLPG